MVRPYPNHILNGTAIKKIFFFMQEWARGNQNILQTASPDKGKIQCKTILHESSCIYSRMNDKISKQIKEMVISERKETPFTF